MTTTEPTLATQVYRVYIKATPEQIWTAITDPEWTNRYGYTGFSHYEPLEVGGKLWCNPNEEFKAQFRQFSGGAEVADPLLEGSILEAEAPVRLKTTWRFLMVPEMAAEPESTITYDIKDLGNGSCRLTLTHELPQSPVTAAMVAGVDEDQGQGGGGGHAWVLSDLKSLLETGAIMATA